MNDHSHCTTDFCKIGQTVLCPVFTKALGLEEIPTDGAFKAGFNHPCRQICSGWQHGYDCGRVVAGITSDAFVNLQRALATANERIVEFEKIKEAHLKYQDDQEKRITSLMNELDAATLKITQINQRLEAIRR